ncbi:pseudouridine synthase [Rozella allomycis CSF55]|uniref:Pseudouridine synthase n=1 Tax=Rozella allomycis (strain CSF55) TaxID=988480 RepID=A0A075AMI3_ROZAC|nr:Pseudouridine synthase, RluC/RluD domain-containing protein [Rozella allomycis CSF55]RKP21896.1 pseudouridine synthase [Rozella allomycis CSF55]|eukprot:EPZ30826.1 Pseudouridine synthase, RluC/RluD domain-containing protein [Rozella allomycis CSF55]
MKSTQKLELAFLMPYIFTDIITVKERMKGKNLKDATTSEFKSLSGEYIDSCTNLGLLKVNLQRCKSERNLKSGEIITHRHWMAEPEVDFTGSLRVQYINDNLIAIEKWPTIPVHPVGIYRKGWVGMKLDLVINVFASQLVNRLDLMVSGIMFVSKSSLMCRELTDLLGTNETRKEYICRVYGAFPSYQITCDKPLLIRDKVAFASDEGKFSVTKFRKLKTFNDGTSLVHCEPITGRTHQIRVHLQYLGFPIVNDHIYANQIYFGQKMGRNGLTFEEQNETLAIINDEIEEQWEDFEYPAPDNPEVMIKYRNKKNAVQKKPILLHALKYKLGPYEAEASIPSWAE